MHKPRKNEVGNQIRVYIIHTDDISIKKMNKQISQDNEPYSCIYLGRNPFIREKILKQLQGNIKATRIGKLLQACVRESRDAYIKYVDELFSGYESPLWFLTSLWEKNPFITNLHLHFCYLSVSMEIIGNFQGKKMVFICENRGVITSLKVNIERKLGIIPIIYAPNLSVLINRSSYFLQFIRNKTEFILVMIYRIIIARLYRFHIGNTPYSTPSKNTIAIHSWTDKRSFTHGNRFHAFYYGDLGDYLEKRQIDLLYIADVLPKDSYKRVVKKLKQIRQKNIFLFEEFITFQDVIKSIIQMFIHIHHFLDPPQFQGIELSAVISDEIKQEKKNSRVVKTFLYKPFSKNLSKKMKIYSFLFAFENHTWEKMICQSLKEFFPDIQIAGYAIVYINSLYTCYSISEKEIIDRLVPDKIFVCGEQGKDMLSRTCYPQSNVIVSGAIRYPNLNNIHIQKEEQKVKVVLVALSAEINSTLELIYKSIAAFTNEPDISILIKPHPLIPYSRFKQYLSVVPENFKITETPISELLCHVNVVLYTESTVSLEAVSAGVPILHVSSDHNIDIDIFCDEPSVPSYSDPAEILSGTRKILNGDYLLPSRDFIEYLFKQVKVERIGNYLLNYMSENQK